MSFLDKLYYLSYCTITGGAVKPVEMLGTRKMKYHPYAFQLFLIQIILYVCDAVTYIGIMPIIKKYTKDDIGIYFFLGLFFVVAFLLYWYLSNGKDAQIVAYYNIARVNSKTKDALTPLVLVLTGIIMLGLFSWLQIWGLPLPLLKYFVQKGN